MSKTFCLIGNPNCGKTTLFNMLTGTYQKVGNWTGVTVEKKEGYYKKDKSIKIVDLPGIYSLSVNSIDEKVVEKYLNEEVFDCVINVVDGTNLERNLFLTYKLLQKKYNIVLAINMLDILEKKGIIIDTNELQHQLKIPVVKVSATKGTGIKNLIEVAQKTVRKESVKIDEKDIFFEIEKVIKSVVNKRENHHRKDKIDNFLVGGGLGLIFFFFVMTFIYFLSLKIGGILGEYISKFFENSCQNIFNFLSCYGISDWAINLVTNGIVGGIGTVFSFLPQIAILFMLLTIIEECGYASRIALIFDKLFRKLGLSGKSILPLIVSSGCSITGLMATRVIESDSERKMTIFLSPFIPCSAKIALFSWFSSIYFNGNPFVASSMYFLGFFAIFLGSKVLVNLGLIKSEKSDFILEIPPYRLPSIKNVFFAVLEKIKDFIIKVGTTILSVSILLWFVSSFGINGYVGGNIENSFIYKLGILLKWIFIPLGFGSPECSVSIISGLLAKESIIESLTILGNGKSLFSSYFSAYSFMAFILLSPPCISALITAKKEIKSNKQFAQMIIFQFSMAYIVALIINFIGIITKLAFNLLFSAIIVIISLLVSFILVKISLKNKCYFCKRKGKDICKKHQKHNMI